MGLTKSIYAHLIFNRYTHKKVEDVWNKILTELLYMIVVIVIVFSPSKLMISIFDNGIKIMEQS